MKITQTFLFLVSTFGLSSLFAQAPDSLVGQNMYLTHSSSDSDDSGVEEFYFGQNLLWSRDTYNGEWNDQAYSWEKTSASTGDLTFFWNDYERVDLDVTFTDSTNATFTYTSYDLEDDGEVVEGGTGSGTISLVDESYEPPFDHFFVEDFSPDQSSPNKFFRAPGDEFFGLTISQQKGLYSLRGNFTGDPDEDNPNQKHVEIAADSVLSFDQSWTVGGTPFSNFPEQENVSTDYGWSKVRIERTGDDGELHVGLQFRPSPTYGTQVSSSLYYEPKVGSGFENTYDGAYLSVSGEPNLRIVNNANTAILSFEVWNDGSWHTLLSLNTVSGTYSLPHTSENQISGWNSLAGKHAYPLMMFELPASYDSNGEMTVLPLEANQVGFSNYYVAEGLGSHFQTLLPLIFLALLLILTMLIGRYTMKI